MATKHKAPAKPKAPTVTVIDPGDKEHKGTVVDGSDESTVTRNIDVDGTEVTATRYNWADSGWRWRPTE